MLLHVISVHTQATFRLRDVRVHFISAVLYYLISHKVRFCKIKVTT